MFTILFSYNFHTGDNFSLFEKLLQARTTSVVKVSSSYCRIRFKSDFPDFIQSISQIY